MKNNYNNNLLKKIDYLNHKSKNSNSYSNMNINRNRNGNGNKNTNEYGNNSSKGKDLNKYLKDKISKII